MFRSKLILTVIVLFGMLGVFGRNQADAAPSAVPLAHWNFDEGSGSTTTSASPQSLTATISGAQWTTRNNGTPSDSLNALLFDGSNDRVEATDDTLLNVTDAATFAAWVNPTGTGSPTHGGVILSKAGSYEIARYPDGTIRWAFANQSPGWTWTNTKAELPLNQWAHVAVTYSASEGVATLYVDGIQRSKHYVSGPIGDVNSNYDEFQIGARSDATQFFKGAIDEVYVFDSALSASDVLTLSGITHTVCPVPALFATIDAALTEGVCDVVELAADTYSQPQIDVTSPVIIRGAGEDDTFIQVDATPSLVIYNESALTLQDLTVRGGYTPWSVGGGLYNATDAHLNLINVAFRDNGTTQLGGAIHNSGGSISADNVHFQGNYANDGAAIYSYTDHDIIIENSNFSDNDADSFGGGLYVTGGNGIVIRNTHFTENDAGAEGGAINIEANVTVLIEDSEFVTNATDGTGGAIMNNASSDMTIRNSSFELNDSQSSGGAITNWNSAILLVEDSYFRSNRGNLGATLPQGGGAIRNDYSAVATVRRSSFSRNWSNGNGGAISQDGGGLFTIENSSFEANNGGGGGAVHTLGGTVHLYHNTFRSNYNTATNGGAALRIFSNGTIRIKSNIFADNDDQNCTVVSGSLISEGYNLSTDSSCNANSALHDLQNTDAMVGSLQSYEGSQWPVIPLLDGSLALDRGNPDQAACSGLDGRGAPRFATVTPIGGCDIGAIEVTEDTLNTQWFEPWKRYYDWAISDIDWLHPSFADGGFVDTGRIFRTTELSRPDQNEITTLSHIEQNYRDNTAEGRTYWRFCADYTSVAANANGWNSCEAYGSDSDFGHAVGNLSDGGTKAIDIHNMLVTAPPHFDALFNGSQVNGTYAGSAITPQGLAISGTLQTTYELGATFLVYGNEFLADALRHNVTGAVVGTGGQVNTGEAILLAEIDELNDALAMFELANESLFLALDHELGGEAGNYLGNYFTPQMFATYAVASERQVETLIEIANREWLLSFSPGSSRDAAAMEAVVDSLKQAYATQYMQALAFAERATATGGSNAFLDNGGQQLVDNLDRLLSMAETIRTNDNPLGYDSAYVPTKPFVELYNRFNDDILPDTYASETAAGSAQRTFDQNASELLAPGGELEMLTDELSAELASICGDNNAPTYSECVVDESKASELQIATQDMRIAHQAVALAWQEAMNISEIIRIEQETAQAVISINDDFGAATTMDAYDLALAKMDGYLQAGTTAQPAQDPYDPSGAAFWINTVQDGASCFIAGLTLGAVFGDRCSDAIFDSAHDAFGTGHGKIDPASEEWSPNNALAVEVQIADMQRLREAERDGAITAAKSSQRIRELLLDQSDLLLAYEIELEEMNRVILERNALMERFQRLSNRLSRFENDIDFNPYDPIQRVIRDHTAEAANHDLNRAIHYAYMTAKALEYALPNGAESFDTQIPYHELYQARRVEHVDDFVTLLFDTYENIPDPTPYLATISLARDVFGLDNVYIDGLLAPSGYAADPASTTWPFAIAACNGTITDRDTLRTCMFQDRLQRGITSDSQVTGDSSGNKEVLFVRFGTSLEMIDPFDFFWYQKLAPVGTADPGCTVSSGNADGCQGVAVNVQTTQTGYPVSFIATKLTHKGVNSYRRPSNGTTPGIAYFSPGRSVNLVNIIPSVFDDVDGTTVAMQGNINGSGLNAEYGGFEGLSSAASDWRLEIDLTNGQQSQLDVSQMTDIVLTMDTLAYSASQRAAEDAQVWSDFRRQELMGEEISAETQSKISQLIERHEAEKQASVQGNRSAPQLSPQSSVVRSNDLLGGSYNGSFAISSPVPLGMVDIGFTLTRTGNTVYGQLCEGCTPHLDSAPQLTGVFTYTGTPTNTFLVNTQPFTQTIDGRTVTRTITIEGSTSRKGDVVSGVYRETIIGYIDEPMEIEGDLIAARAAGHPNVILAPTAVSISSHQVANASNLWLMMAVALGSLTVVARRRRD